jgi:DNA repair and recombination protein RAD54B
MLKPFKPPLLKKPSPLQTSSPASRYTSEPPPKKRRVSDDELKSDCRDREDNRLDKTSPDYGSQSKFSSKASVAPRRPLFTVKNSENVERTTNGPEAYYNVLWRKFTAKKHKSWDGDGVLSVIGGFATLQDVSGREMGRIMFNSPLLPESILSIGGKEVEVDSVISRADFMAGRPFLKPTREQMPVLSEIKNMKPLSLKPVVLPKSLHIKKEAHKEKEESKEIQTVTATRSLGMKSAFKNPLKESTIMPQQKGNEPVPRHDPNATGALVMQRPRQAPKGKQLIDVVLDPLLGKHLREHQREGVKFLYECVMGLREFNGEGAILADEMGLGKTLQTIALLWTLLKQNPVYGAPPVISKALIVCPVTLIVNWQKEFRKWLGNERIGVFVVDGKRTRMTDFTMGKSYSVMIIGYERLRTVQEELQKGSGIDIVIADEGHRLKTVQNKSAKAIQSLNTTKRIILSGTPIQNDLTEFFAMVDFVNPGILGSFKGFMKEFEGPIVKSRQPAALASDIEKGEARSEELARETSQFILRRTANLLSKYLPPKTEYVLFCSPTPSQALIYRNVLVSPVFQSALGNSEASLQLITILKKLCNSPSLLNPRNASEESLSPTIASLLSTLPTNLLRSSPGSSGKLRVLDQLLHNLRADTSEKIVLVSNYTSTLNLLANLLTSLSLPFLRLDGSTPSSKRQGLVDQFNRTPANTCFAFLLSAKAGGVGLNLIGASRLVLFDVDWNPSTDLQAMARIHRDGQKRHCRVYRILMKGGIEEKIWQRQVTKLGLADSIMEQKVNTAQFSRKELRDLFRLDEREGCATHDLMKCECGGKGEMADDRQDSEIHEIIEVQDSEVDEDVNDHPLDNSDDDRPILPSFTRASRVYVEEQERHIRNGSHPLQQTSSKINDASKMQSLLEYKHIDTSKFSSADWDLEEDIRMEELIGDEVLYGLLREEGNGVSWVFKKDAKGAKLQSPKAEVSESRKAAG